MLPGHDHMFDLYRYKTQSFIVTKLIGRAKKVVHFVVFGSNGSAKVGQELNKDVHQLYHRYKVKITIIIMIPLTPASYGTCSTWETRQWVPPKVHLRL